jgi:glutamine amidotransferase
MDYGLGNIKSLFNSLKKIGFNPEFFSNKKNKQFDMVFIPGVGSYYKASKLIYQKKYLDFLNIHKQEGSIFGICLGMQLFGTYGDENKKSKGLNLIKGHTKKIMSNVKKLYLPFVGYQKVNFINNKKYSYLKKFNNEKFYFVHSYAITTDNKNNILGQTKNQGIKFTSAIYDDRVIGTQFHPEKSGEVGLEFLKESIINFS